jgi:hypothetical protein
MVTLHPATMYHTKIKFMKSMCAQQIVRTTVDVIMSFHKRKRKILLQIRYKQLNIWEGKNYPQDQIANN